MRTKSKKLPGKTIRKVRMGGIRMSVQLAAPEEVPELYGGPDGAPLDGFCDFERGAVFVRRGLSPDIQNDAVAHELGHGFIYTTGIGHFLRSQLKDGVDYEAFEETLVRLATPHLSTWIKKGGGK